MTASKKKNILSGRKNYLKESGGTTIARLKENLKENVNAMNKGANARPLCWECWFIGKTLRFIKEEPRQTVPAKFVIL
jgi:hypothetical protein